MDRCRSLQHVDRGLAMLLIALLCVGYPHALEVKGRCCRCIFLSTPVSLIGFSDYFLS